jgi:hypothetical protein
MFFNKFRKFGRQIFNLYESRPLLMNSIAGAVVYVGGELTVQVQESPTTSKVDVKNFDWSRIAKIGTLGAAENGYVMLTW